MIDLESSQKFREGAGELASVIAGEMRRGAESPDYFSTRKSAEISRVLRDTPTLGLDSLLNLGGTRIDVEGERIYRDSFWKGSFAKDSLLGLEERIRNVVFGNAKRTAQTFTGGSFWKRFDRIAGGTAFGYVVNYELAALPGLPEVREVAYPDDKRRYFRKGDPILLLRYTNDPYKAVYDAIKVIDENNALGVMHVGEFPNGVEVAKFVMARHNYPFDNMSVEDHDALFEGAAQPSSGAALEGQWKGRLVFLETADTSLANQYNPILMRVKFRAKDGETVAHWTAGGANARDRVCGAGELKMLKPNLVLGRWSFPKKESGLDKLNRALGGKADEPEMRFVLRKIGG